MPTLTVKNTFPNTYVVVLNTAFPLMFIYCKYNTAKVTTLQISHCTCTVRNYFLWNTTKNVSNEVVPQESQL